MAYRVTTTVEKGCWVGPYKVLVPRTMGAISYTFSTEEAVKAKYAVKLDDGRWFYKDWCLMAYVELEYSNDVLLGYINKNYY